MPEKLICMIDDNKHVYVNFKIFLLVPNKKSVVKDVDSGSTKIEKAKSYGIRIMSLEEFQNKY